MLFLRHPYRFFCYTRYTAVAGNDGAIPVKSIVTQKQFGSTDCGLFAIANMFSLNEGMDPCRILFQQNLMRPHLIQCLEEKSVVMFLHTVTVALNRRVYQSSEILLSKYCICLANMFKL
jgi:hypothetical protein